MSSIPRNQLKDFLDILEKEQVTIDPLNFELLEIDCRRFREELEQCIELKTNRIYAQLYYLTQQYSDKNYNIDPIEDYEVLDPELSEKIKQILKRSDLGFIHPQQYFNYILDNRRERNAKRIGTVKQSKWGMKGKLIQKSDTGIFYYLPVMSRETIDSELVRWNTGYSIIIDEIGVNEQVSCLNLDSSGNFSPVLKVPILKGINLNDAFSNPIFHKKIVSALITIKQEKTSQGEKIKAKKSDAFERCRDMHEEFNLLKQQFPRIHNRWERLDNDLKLTIFRCYMDIRDNEFGVIHKSKTAFVHGDEWGDNFFFMERHGQIFPIDFEDLITLEGSNIVFGNSFLAKRIWQDVSVDFDQYLEQRREIPEQDLPTISSIDTIFDVDCSNGRLFCALVQRWICLHEDYLIDNEIAFQSMIRNLFFDSNMQAKTEWENLKFGRLGWFFLAAIDWALHWERRKPGQIDSKFPQPGLNLFFSNISEYVKSRIPDIDYYSALVSSKLTERIDANSSFKLLMENFRFVSLNDKEEYEFYKSHKKPNNSISALNDLLTWHLEKKQLKKACKKIGFKEGEKTYFLADLSLINEIGFQTEILGFGHSQFNEIASFLGGPIHKYRE